MFSLHHAMWRQSRACVVHMRIPAHTVITNNIVERDNESCLPAQVDSEVQLLQQHKVQVAGMLARPIIPCSTTA